MTKNLSISIAAITIIYKKMHLIKDTYNYMSLLITKYIDTLNFTVA